MDVTVVSEAVAGLLAAGGVKELGEAAGGGLVAGVMERVRKVFGSDARSVDALERAQRRAGSGGRAGVGAGLVRAAEPGVRRGTGRLGGPGRGWRGDSTGSCRPGRLRRGPGPDGHQLPHPGE